MKLHGLLVKIIHIKNTNSKIYVQVKLFNFDYSFGI